MSTHDAEQFPSGTEGLSSAVSPQVVELADGERFELRIGPVVKRLGDDTVRMLAYNGSVPGPVLKVREGSQVVVDVENQGDLDATVHWHGLRLDNRYDGTHSTQKPVGIGERFEYRLEFPDPGAYWYHPHIRQDYGQEMGLYGTILVVPSDARYWAPVHRELMVTLDDVLIEHGRIAPFDPQQTSYSAMGRFGNRMLINGEPELHLSARRDEVIRFYLTNTANTRVFNFAVANARMKVVGGDSGRCEHEELVESVILSPSERVVLDVLFDTPGTAALEHRTPGRTYALGAVEVDAQPADPGPADAFGELRTNAEMVAERERIAPYLDAAPDKTLSRGRDGLRRARRSHRVLLPDAPGSRKRGARQVPPVCDEAHAARCRARLHVPDASRRTEQRAGEVSLVRDEAHAGLGRPGRCHSAPAPCRPRARPW